jgi:hypothetical protein
VVQIVVHQLVPKTNQKKLQPEKRYRCLADGGGSDLAGTLGPEKKRTVVWPAMFFSGFKLEPEKITAGKKRYSRVVWPAVFSGGFKFQPEKNTTRKIKGTVVWPMEAAQIWRERYDRGKKKQSSGRLCFSAGSNYNWKKIRPKKNRYSRLAVSWKLE